MTTGIEQIKKKVKNHELPLVIALSGNERALLDDVVALIREHYLETASAELNHHKYSAADDMEDLQATLFSMPFLAPFRLVEVHDAEKLQPKVQALLIEYAQKPCVSTQLVLVFNKADKKNKLIAQLESSGSHVNLGPIEGDERRKFLLDQAKALGVSLAPNAVDLLLSMTDGDLLLIKSALDKLSLIGEEVTVNHVEEHICSAFAQDVFWLARSISEGRLEEALIALGKLRDSHENAIKFLGVLMWQMRVLVHIRCCLDEGLSDWDTRKHVSVFGDRFVWMASIAKKRSLQFHIERLAKLVDCDKALKTGAIHEPFHVIEKFVYQSAVGL